MSRRNWPILLLVAAALSVKLIALWQLHDHPLLQPREGLDSGVYLDLARQIAAGHLLGGDRSYFVSPLYMYFEAIVLAVSGGSTLAVQVVQVLLGAIGVGLIAATARRWYGDAGAWIAGALALFTGYFTFNEILLLQSSLDVFLTSLWIWLLGRATTRRDFAFAGLVLGLHVLNRPNMLMWAVALPVLFAITRRRMPAVAIATGLALALAPVAIRNAAVAGELTLVSSHGGLNFYIGNNATAPGTYRAVPGVTPSIEGQDRDVRQVVSAAVGHPAGDSETSQWFYRQAVGWIGAHPIDAIVLYGRKLAYLCNATDVALNDSFEYYVRDERTILPILAIGPGLLVPFGLAGVAFTGWRPKLPAPALVALFIVVYGLSVALFFIAGRYRLPMLAAFCLTSAGACVYVWRELQARHMARLVIAGGVIAALTVFSHLDLGLDDGRRGWEAEMVLQHIKDGRDVEAEADVARLEHDFPNPALLHYRTAQAYSARGEGTKAIPHFERALAGNENRPDVRLELGHALLIAGRGQEAVPELIAALNASIKPELAASELGRALAGQSAERVRAAIHEIQNPAALPPASQAVIGRIALGAGDASTAVEWLARATAASPDPAALGAYGFALVQLGRLPEAARAFEQACQLDPRNPAAHVNLAATYAQMRRLDDARREVEDALRLDPGSEKARRLLETLRK